jgi:heme exporter protein CcmD
MMGASHAGFIIVSYAATAAVFLGLALRAYGQHRALRAELARLEERGARRRSTAGSGS